MINTIIFDIGKVLVGYDWNAYMMNIFNNDKDLVKLLSKAFFNSGVWNELDRGIWTEEELLEGFAKNAPGKEKEIRLFWSHVGDALWQYDFSKDWLRNLKSRGYKLLYLSNWSHHMKEQAGEKLDFIPLMDGGVFSYKVKKIKPDAEIYKEIIKKYDLIPEQCVFLDDVVENVESARALGINGIVVDNHDQAVRELEALLQKS